MLMFSNSDSKVNSTLLTLYSLIHFLYGFSFFLLIVGAFKINVTIAFILWFIIHGCYEIKDFYVSYHLRHDDYMGNNSLINSIGDQTVGMLGFLAGYCVSQSGIKLTHQDMFYIFVFTSLCHLIFHRFKLA